jgi:hypothetical protein
LNLGEEPTFSVEKNNNKVKNENNDRVNFLSEQIILGEDYQIFWTDLSRYYPERESKINQLQVKYARKSKSLNTLVIELVGTFL